MRIPRFEYHAPKTIDEALGLLKKLGEKASLAAGGTDIFVGLPLRNYRGPRCFVIIIQPLRRLRILLQQGKYETGVISVKIPDADTTIAHTNGKNRCPLFQAGRECMPRGKKQ